MYPHMLIIRMKKVTFFLHKKMIKGRARFISAIEKNFQELIELVQKNDWYHFLNDRGQGSPPVEYLVAVEKGLRNYCDDVHAMGTHPLRSRRHWSRVRKWRKRETYIGVARFLLGMTSGYRQWDCFLFEDYTSRQIMSLTFNVRHYPLSDGNDRHHFGESMTFDWDSHRYNPTRKIKTTVKKEDSVVQKVVSKTSIEVTGPQIYDPISGCLTDPIDLTL